MSGRKLVVYANPEKKGHGPSKDPFIPAPPFRMVMVGPPGCGKRSAVMNIVANLEKPPKKIVVIHGDPSTIEYQGVTDDVRGPTGVPTIEEMRGSVPEKEEGKEEDSSDSEDEDPFAEQHKLVIVDEIPWHSLKRETLGKFERLFNHVSTHANTSVILCFQQLVAIPPGVRRAIDHALLFKHIDLPAADNLAQRVGLSRKALQEIMGADRSGNPGIVREKHDSLWIDLTAQPEDPWRMRLNLWTPILPRVD